MKAWRCECEKQHSAFPDDVVYTGKISDFRIFSSTHTAVHREVYYTLFNDHLRSAFTSQTQLSPPRYSRSEMNIRSAKKTF